MSEAVSLHAVISGRVQGVFFRAFVLENAVALGLSGWVRNLPTGRDVEVQAKGEREKLEKLVTCLQNGPPSSFVEKVTVTWSKYAGKYFCFEIRD
jgi:acylphosphatase